ncbi:MAG: hypothetical protein EBS79_13610 [Gammaproteobacteria bacterium]|nr:hypothetical protein [Gammaproteobacteria bacterium]NDE56154.1 hypothetical protein [Gammaproteobacteria bacterium]
MEENNRIYLRLFEGFMILDYTIPMTLISGQVSLGGWRLAYGRGEGGMGSSHESEKGPVLAVVTMGLSWVFCRSPFGGLLGSNALPSDGYLRWI